MGEIALTADDVASRVAVLEARGALPDSMKSTPGLPLASPQALLELLREALEREVARGLGVEPTAADLAALDRHATATSRDPATLAHLRELLGDQGFTRQVLLPRATSIQLGQRFAAEPAADAGIAYDWWYRQHAARVRIELSEPVAAALCPIHAEVWWLERPCAGVGVR